jgi:hypothetical protein
MRRYRRSRFSPASSLAASGTVAQVLALFATSAVVVSACGSSGGDGTGGGGETDAATTDGTAGDGGPTSDGGIHLGPDGATCQTSTDCDGAVCVGGSCCSADSVCGSLCCTGSTVCLFSECVTPGANCHTASDCAAGQYCETALGSQLDGGTAGEGGTSNGDGGACTQPPPLDGKCVALPPICPADAGAPGPDAGCVADCEYHPPVGGMLNAISEWAWGPTATVKPNFTDVWATPVVGRVYDTNCDGAVNSLDVPVIIFVSGNDLDGYPAGTNCQTATLGGTSPSMCHTGALRVLDGSTGEEIWTLANLPGSVGFAGMSVAIGDVDGDGVMDIVAATGEGNVVLLDSTGALKRTSNMPIPGDASTAFGWGGGLSIADMDGDGFPEISYGATLFTTTNGAITLKFTGAYGMGGGSVTEAISTLADLDGAANNHLEILAGNTAYEDDGTVLWHRADLPDGFPGIGDFNADGKPDVVLVGPVSNGTMNQATVWLLNGADGTTLLGPVTLPTTVHASDGGPPTVAAFDGSGVAEIGVATADYYWMLSPNFTTSKIDIVWKTPNHDFSSSVTGSTVFDFEGAGHPSVIYADECYLWVFDGATGDVRFSAPHTSFTGTEASLVADIDGDGHAEILMIANGADPSSAGWGCMNAAGTPVTINGVEWTPSSFSNKSYRGITAFNDMAHSWVGTRTLWNEHAYHVSNICDDLDTACIAPNVYGSIPHVEQKNWNVPWLNNFRQNVQDKGLFNAPDATVTLAVACASPAVLTASVRNIGLASLPAGINVGIYKGSVAMENLLGMVTTTHPLLPGQTEALPFTVPAASGTDMDTYVAQIIIDASNPTFHECDANNDTSALATANCPR